MTLSRCRVCFPPTGAGRLPWPLALRQLASSSLIVLIAIFVGTLWLVACGSPPQPAPSPDQTPRTQPPALRPRAFTTAAAAGVTPTPEAAQTAPPESSEAPGATAFVQVATGYNHWCALLKDGTALCQGANDQGQLNVPQDARFRRIAAGWGFNCGIQTDGSITCWGRNNHHQSEPPDGPFTALDAGWDHACAIGPDRTVCWGRNANERATPPSGVTFTAIGAGAEHSCGLTVSGDLVCWGKNDNERAMSRAGPFRALAVGIAHSCVLREDGTALCQGENAHGQSDPPDTAFTHITAGSDRTCGILATSHLECWGANPGSSGDIVFAPHGQYTSVSVGWEIGCGINDDAHVVCWSSKLYPRYGAGNSRLLMIPVTPSTLFSNPTEVLAWPSGGLAVAEKTGSVVALTSDLDLKPILDLTTVVDFDGYEKGFLSIAIDPQFKDYPFLYVYYTMHHGDDPSTTFARLSRFPVVNGKAVIENELTILDISRNNQRDLHWGGAIRFGPDGMLYLGIGDSACEECSQNLATLHGKIIRIDVREPTSDQPYRVPDDNPFVGVPEARPEIWAYGLRNPWRMAFDSENGRLWVGDVGDRFEEEISVATSGANLGWPVFEGFLHRNYKDHALEDYIVDPFKDEDFKEPIIAYSHIEDPDAFNCAVVGGLVYRGTAIPWLNGTYLFGDFCSGQIWVIDGTENAVWKMLEIADLDRPVSSFGTDADGEVLVLTFGGPILRLSEGVSDLAPSVTHDLHTTSVTTPSIPVANREGS